MVRTMTRAQYEAEFGMKPVFSGVSKLDTTVAPRVMTRAEYEKEFPSAKQITQKDLSATKGFAGYADKVNEAKTAGQEKMSQATKSWSTSLRAPIDLAVGASEYITSPIAPLFEPLGKAIDFVGNKISDSPSVQKFADSKTGQVTADLAQVLQDASMVTGTVGILGDPLILRPKARPSYIGKTTLEVPKAPPPPPKAPPPPPKAVAKVAQEIYNIENNYKTLRDANDYAKDAGAASRERIASTDVLVNSTDDSGRVRTKQPGGAVEQYRKLKIDDKESVVRDLLVKEGKTVNLAEVRRDLVTEVYKSGLEGADLVTALKGVQKEITGLSLRADEFGNILLEKIHDAKISTTRNIDFNTPAETKTYRKSVARAYKQVVENKSSVEVKIGDKTYKVADINAELGKYYGDIERLASLDGRIVKGGRLGKYTAQISGNIIGGVAGAALGPLGMLVGPVLGGEAAGFLKGRAMASTFGRSRGFVATENPILARARQEAGLPPIKDLSIPDTKIGVPKGIPKTKEVISLEKQIERNVEAQKVAIKAKDFTLVSALKEIYANLVAKLKEVIQRIKATPGKEGGFVKVGDYSNNLGKRNTQYSKTSTKPITSNIETNLTTIPKELQPLAQEAMKYKSAEEFVKARTKLYHGTTSKNAELIKQEGFKIGQTVNAKDFGDGIYLTPSLESASRYGGNIIETSIKPNLKIKNIEVPVTLTKEQGKTIALEAKNSGYDGIRINHPDLGESVVIFDAKNILTKSQLTDLWNKVNKKK